ncbi:unnamed protein product [Polarella glacialis]|uniref:5'-nucleotidase n=1 Tax=Polarella glacialis TaxID=89957 RepID=A0A813FZJ7_POLGL|nr:unnamed protein product [Polarella glacialis]|mmetsp:Transcript_10585/g.16907  ORF Transcript_10585/g.16907 Transcript_10585/m.16907 type:complete len:511 (+) Transcript_10585:93-1625(+)
MALEIRTLEDCTLDDCEALPQCPTHLSDVSATPATAPASSPLHGYSSEVDSDDESCFKLDPVSLSDMDWIGFDLDHTLVRYKLDELLPLVYRCICSYLVEQRGVHSKVFDVPYDFGFCERGLVFDGRTGDLIKLDAFGCVRIACHGYSATSDFVTGVSQGSGRFLSTDEVHQRYGADAWRGLNELRQNWRAEDADIFATLFEVPACQAAALLVDEIDRQALQGAASTEGANAYASILPDIRAALHKHMKWENFAKREGGYFPCLAEQVDKFVLPRETVRTWLENLRRAGGKRLFLLTNSNWDYADMVMAAAFGSDWRDLFDLSVYRASKKGGFFDHRRPFKTFQRESLGEQAMPHGLKAAHKAGIMEFVEGNVKDLSELFGEDASVLYFGDDLNGDITITHRRSEWHTAAVVEELCEHTPATPWGPIFSFSSDVFEPSKSGSFERSFSAEEASDSSSASHILEMVASTADFALPDLATITSHPLKHKFDHGCVFMGAPPSKNISKQVAIS